MFGKGLGERKEIGILDWFFPDFSATVCVGLVGLLSKRSLGISKSCRNGERFPLFRSLRMVRRKGKGIYGTIISDISYHRILIFKLMRKRESIYQIFFFLFNHFCG